MVDGAPASSPRRGPSARRTADILRLEALYGSPRELDLEVGMHPWEFDLLRFSKRDGRYRDATILIPYEGKLVCIAKHAYPAGIARPPSGGVVPGEPLDSAAEREAWEETGLRVRILRYVLRVCCLFTPRGDDIPGELALAEASRRGRDGSGYRDAIDAFARENPARDGEPEYWESHVFWADPVGGRLDPRDTREVRSVELVDPGELVERVHPAMRAAGIGGFAYRVRLQEAALAVAREEGLLRVSGPQGS